MWSYDNLVDSNSDCYFEALAKATTACLCLKETWNPQSTSSLKPNWSCPATSNNERYCTVAFLVPHVSTLNEVASPVLGLFVENEVPGYTVYYIVAVHLREKMCCLTIAVKQFLVPLTTLLVFNVRLVIQLRRSRRLRRTLRPVQFSRRFAEGGGTVRGPEH